MLKKVLAAGLFSLFPGVIFSQVAPQEGSRLNYRIIGFSIPEVKNAQGYTIEIAKGSWQREDSFKRNVVNRVHSTKHEGVGEVPAFGAEYTWRALYTTKQGGQGKTALYHFSTLSLPEADTSQYRLNVTTRAESFSDAYVFVDANRALYDMRGRPVWFLPYVDSTNASARDIKMTAEGTITFLVAHNAYEVDYDGNILWKGPDNGAVNGDTTEYYHHEVTRLRNGHYMVLGNERMMIKLPSAKDSTMRFLPMLKMFRGKNMTFKATQVGTIIEYDDKGNVVWSWKASKYFTSENIEQYGSKADREKLYTDVHENAFWFDEDGRNIYLSFKNLNLVLKIKYPDGKVVGEYAKKFDPAFPLKVNKLFCGQHSVCKTSKGYLMTFNNNDCDPSGYAKVVVMQEPVVPGGKLKKVWEYECTNEQAQGQPQAQNPMLQFRSTVGGSVAELPDQCILVSTSSSDGRVMIVNQDKQVLWSAVAEKWNADAQKWEVNNNAYRCAIVLNEKQLEQLIWGGRNKINP